MINFTIITVVKNNLNGLKSTYASLIRQINQNYFWQVIDGGSSDGTLEWLEKIDRDNFNFFSGPDNSLFNAMNKGIDRLESDYCLFLNGGDFFWNEYVIDNIIKSIKENKYILGYGKYVLGSIRGFGQRERGRYIKTYLDMFRGPVPCHQSMVISKKAFFENGLYLENQGIYGDTEWIIRYSKKRHPSTFTFLPFIISFYNPDGISYQRFFKDRNIYFRILWKYGDLVEFGVGLWGWTKTAIYVTISKYLDFLLKKIFAFLRLINPFTNYEGK